MTPSEDPQAAKARDRERRLAELERRKAAQQTSTDLRTDISSVYGLPSYQPSIFSMKK